MSTTTLGQSMPELGDTFPGCNTYEELHKFSLEQVGTFFHFSTAYIFVD